jgi:integrase
MTENLISNELLKNITQNGTLSVDAIVAQLRQMEERQKYLDMHTHNIWLASDGYWKTKVKESDGTKRLIKLKDRSDLEDAIINHYKRLSLKDNSFKARFNVWIDRQRDCGRCENTILKYKSDYKRFFDGYSIENIDIKDIDDILLSKHILQVLNDKQIPWRAFKDIMGYTSGVYEKAVRDKVIQDNPFKYIDLPIYKKYCYIPPVKTTQQRTLSEKDTHTLLDRVRHPRAHNTNKICCFAIELAIYTGMRVGELAALMWEDIIFEEDIILIRHSEKFDRTTKQSVISTTKTGKERIFPMVDEIKSLLFKIRTYEMDHGWLGVFVFQDADGRVTKSKISDTTRNITMSDDFTGIKSIHAIRRTFNSRLKCNGVSTTIASSLLGHTERINEQNYTYDVSELAEKKELVNAIVTASNA